MGNVLVLNQFALPRDQGGGTRHADLFGRVEGWRARIIAGDRNHYTQKKFETPNSMFSLVRLPAAGPGAVSRLRSWLVYAVRAVLAATKTKHVDVVIGSSPHLLAPVAARLVASLKRIPFVLEVRDLWPESLVSAGAISETGLVARLLTRLERWLARTADAIIVVTPGWEEHFEDLGIHRDKVHVVPNGAELEDFRVSSDRQSLREKYEIAGYTAVFAGAHGPKDGLDYIVRAAVECPEVNFLLIGSGPAKQGAIEDVRRLRVTNVEFRDPIPKAVLPELLAACDVGIHAVTPLSVFDHGMSPNKLFDYLAAGLPIVSNARTPLRAVLGDGQCGRIGDADSLGANIKAVMGADQETTDRWRAAAREIMTSRYSRAAAAQALGEVLGRVVAHERS